MVSRPPVIAINLKRRAARAERFLPASPLRPSSARVGVVLSGGASLALPDDPEPFGLPLNCPRVPFAFPMRLQLFAKPAIRRNP